jgi:putative acetyltransferase
MITLATRDDAAGVIDLIGRVFAEYGWIWQPVTEVPDLFDFSAHYEGDRGGFWIARAEGHVVASVGVERLDADTAELHRLYVDPGWRRQGLGDALVHAALEWCRTRRIRRLVLWSDTRFESSHRLYTRLGFSRHGERTVEGDINHSREYRFERTV